MADPPRILIQSVRAAAVDCSDPGLYTVHRRSTLGSCVDLTGRGGGMHPPLPVRAHSVYSTYGGSHREGWLATPCAAQYMDEDFEEWTGTAAPLHLRLATSLLFYTGDCLLASSYLPTLMYGRLPTQGWCPMMSFPRPCHRSTGAPCR